MKNMTKPPQQRAGSAVMMYAGEKWVCVCNNCDLDVLSKGNKSCVTGTITTCQIGNYGCQGQECGC